MNLKNIVWFIKAILLLLLFRQMFLSKDNKHKLGG